MEFETTKQSNILIIKPLIDELKMHTATEFRSEVLELVAASKLPIVLLNLARIKNIDSSGVGAIVNIGLKILSLKGKAFSLCHAHTEVAKILGVTHIDRLFPLFSDIEEAVTNFEGHLDQKGRILYVGTNQNLFNQLKESTPHILSLEKVNTDGNYLAMLVEEPFLSSLPAQNDIPILVLAESKKRYPYRTIQLPLKADEAALLMQSFTHLMKKEEVNNSSKLPAKLMQQYAEALPEKLDQLEALTIKASEEPNKFTFEELRGAIHKISGSAGTYGYVKSGEICKKIELILDESINLNAFEKSTIDHVKELLSKCIFYFNTTFYHDLSQKSPAIAVVKKNMICLITADDTFANVIKNASDDLKLQFIHLNQPGTVIETLKELGHRPEIILFDNPMEDHNSGFEMLKEIKNHLSSNQMKFWMAFEGENFEDHIRASEEGVDLMIKKPVSLNTIESLLSKHMVDKGIEAYRVLVIDDDADICNYIESTLGEIGITVKCQSDASQLLQQLTSFQPNLLLLDINLPKHDGWTVLKTLRNDVRYKDLKIIIITASGAQPKSLLKEFDAIWTKPLDKKELQDNILSFAADVRNKGGIKEVSLASFLPLEQFKKLLHTILPFSRDTQRYLIVIGSLDYAQSSPAGKQDFLTACENLLNQYITQDTLKGYLGEGRFAYYFTGYDKRELERIVEHFITKSEYKINREKGVFVTFSALIVKIDKQISNADELLQFAVSQYEKGVVMASQTLLVEY